MSTGSESARTITAANRRSALLVVTAAFFSMLATANLATPLYAGYSKLYGFSPAVLGLIFATYALVLIPSLLIFGQLSDRLGRRRMIAAGLGVAVVSLTLFAFADGLAWLFAARAVQGLAQGMLGGAATAALSELVGEHDARRAALLATLAQAGGAASGPLLSGMLAQWAPAPRVLPYLVGIAVCATVIISLRAVPETAQETGGGGWRIQRPRVPAEIRADFARVGLTAAAAWAVAGPLFLAVIPAYATGVFHTKNLALLGLISAVMLGSSCVAQLIIRRGAPATRAQAGGLTLLAIGLLALVLAKALGAPGLLVIGAVLAGGGHGLAFLAAQDDPIRIAPEAQRAEISAAFYVCIYLGVALPVIGIGVLAAAISLFTGIAVFAAVTGTASLALAAWHLSHRYEDPDGEQATLTPRTRAYVRAEDS